MHTPYKKSNLKKWFETKTDTKVIVYRTRCPRTYEEVVNALPTTKDVYKKMLLALGGNITYARPNTRATAYITINDRNMGHIKLSPVLTNDEIINGCREYNILGGMELLTFKN